jgi:hypothetical protein
LEHCKTCKFWSQDDIIGSLQVCTKVVQMDPLSMEMTPSLLDPSYLYTPAEHGCRMWQQAGSE